MRERNVCSVEINQRLKILDLRVGAMGVGSYYALGSGIVDRKISQKWSQYFYEVCSEINGIVYNGSKNGGDVVMLYETAEGSLNCVSDLILNDPSLRSTILFIAQQINLIVPPEEYL